MIRNRINYLLKIRKLRMSAVDRVPGLPEREAGAMPFSERFKFLSHALE
jgi:hypothetical protein